MSTRTRSELRSKNEAKGEQSQGMENCSWSLQKCTKYLLLFSHSRQSKCTESFLRRPWQRHSVATGGIPAHLCRREQLANQPSPFQGRNGSADNIITITSTFVTQ